MPIKIEREKKRVEVDMADFKSLTSTVSVRDHVFLEAQKANPEWSLDSDGEVTTYLIPSRRVQVYLVPMLRYAHE